MEKKGKGIDDKARQGEEGSELRELVSTLALEVAAGRCATGPGMEKPGGRLSVSGPLPGLLGGGQGREVLGVEGESWSGAAAPVEARRGVE